MGDVVTADFAAHRRKMDLRPVPVRAIKSKPRPRLGATSLEISFNDTDGFLVKHGDTGDTLVHVSPKFLISSDWDQIWGAIRGVEHNSHYRELEKQRVSGEEDGA